MKLLGFWAGGFGSCHCFGVGRVCAAMACAKCAVVVFPVAVRWGIRYQY